MSEQQDVWTPSEVTGGGDDGEGAPEKLPDVVNVLSEVFDDLMANLVGYLLSGVGIAVVSLGAMFLMLFLVFGGMFGSALLGQAIGEPEAITGIGMMVTFAGYLFAILALIVVLAPLTASLARALLAHQERGEALAVSATFSTFGTDLVQVVLLTVISFVLAMVGMMFCYLPGLAVGLFLSFAFPAVVVHRASAVQAIGFSVRHVREHLTWHLGFWGLGLAILFVGQAIPFVGLLLSMPVFYAYQIRAYTRVFPADQPLEAISAA